MEPQNKRPWGSRDCKRPLCQVWSHSEHRFSFYRADIQTYSRRSRSISTYTLLAWIGCSLNYHPIWPRVCWILLPVPASRFAFKNESLVIHRETTRYSRKHRMGCQRQPSILFRQRRHQCTAISWQFVCTYEWPRCHKFQRTMQHDQLSTYVLK